MLPVRSFFGRDLDLLFDRLSEAPSAPVWRPRLDAHRTDEGFVVEVDLPGIDPDEVDVAVEDGVLSIAGHRLVERSEDGFITERISGSFIRRLTIPEGIEAEDITATYADGVLRLVLPVPAEPEPKVTRVPVSRN